jgi:lantibiotic biosynthesis protein
MTDLLPGASWQPILTGDDRAQALSIVRQIGDALTARDPDDSPGLANGDAGVALFFAYAALAEGTRGWGACADERLEHAIDAVVGGTMSASLYGGFTGIAWAEMHLRRSRWQEDPCQPVDEALVDHLDGGPWTLAYDLVEGLIGIGLYAVDRIALGVGGEAARRCGALVLEHLERLAAGGWWTAPQLLVPETARRYPNGYQNLGVAHGVPAVLPLLALFAEHVDRDRAGRMLTETSRWLTDRQNGAGVGARYSYVRSDRSQDRVPRMSWCYGDLGRSTAMLWAARLPGAADGAAWLEREGLACAESALRLPRQRSRVVDACLCHGAAGLAWMYARLYNAVHDVRFLEEARHWYRVTLAMHTRGEGVGGFRTWDMARDANGDFGWRAKSGLLTGAAGIGLSLLAGATELEPSWDRILMGATPPR